MYMDVTIAWLGLCAVYRNGSGVCGGRRRFVVREGGGTVVYGYIHDSYFGVFVWGIYMPS